MHEPIKKVIEAGIVETNELKTQFEPMPTEQYKPKFDFYSANKITYSDSQKKAVKELENRIRTETAEMINHYQSTIHKTWLQPIKDYMLSTVDRAIGLKKKWMSFMTNEKQPIIKTYTDRTATWLFRGKFWVKVYAQDEASFKDKSMVQTYSNRSIASSNAKKVYLDVWVDACLLWNWFYKTSFSSPLIDKKFLKQAKLSPEEKKAVPLLAPGPRVDYVYPFNIFADPYRDFYTQPVTHRYWDSFINVIKKYAKVFIPTPDQIYHALHQPKVVSTLNFNRIKLIKYYEDFLLSNDIWINLDNFFKVRVNDQMCEVIERYDLNNLVIAINWYIFYDWENPFYIEWSDVRHPFKNVQYTRTPWVWLSQWIWMTLASPQKLYDTLHNIMFDLAKFTAWPMFFLKPWQVVEWMENIMVYEPFAIKKLRWSDDAALNLFEMPKPDAVNFKMMADILSMADLAIQPMGYWQFQTQSRSATDSEYRKEWMKDWLLALSESFWECFTKSLEEFLYRWKKYLPEEFLVAVIGEDGKESWKKINRLSLEWNYIYETEFESYKDIEKIVDRSQFIQLMDVISKMWNDPVTGRRLVNMEKVLWKWFELFGQENAIMGKEEYLKTLEEIEMSKFDIQNKLQKYQRSVQQPSEETQMWAWSQYNNPAQPQAQQVAGMQQPTNVAQILKSMKQNNV